LRSLIPFLATLLLDHPVEASAGLAITLPAGSPEITQNDFTIPIYDSRTLDIVSPVVIAAIRTPHEEQDECRQEVWRTHGSDPIGVFNLINHRHVDKIPIPSRTWRISRGHWRPWCAASATPAVRCAFTIVVVGLPPGQHKVLIELANPEHHVFTGQTVTFTVQGTVSKS
jgi:hypothetical protein